MMRTADPSGKRCDAGLLCRPIAGLLVLAIGTFTGCYLDVVTWAQPENSTLMKPVVRVPLREVWGLPLVQAKIDDQGPFWFLLDTGSEGSFITPRFASEHHLQIFSTNIKTIFLAEGNQVPAEGAIRLGEVEIGEAKFFGVSALVLDLEPIGGLSGEMNVQIAGIFGLPLFCHYLLTLDYPAKTVVLEWGELPPADGRTVWSYEGKNLPTIPVRIGDRAESAILDTGSPGEVSIPDSGGLKIRRGIWRMTANPEEQGIDNPGVYLEGLVRLGDYSVTRPLLNKVVRPSIDGGILKHFTLTFDGRRRRVRLLRKERELILPPFRWPAFTIAYQDGRWVIEDPLTVKAARKGDVITRVNGAESRDMDAADWQRLAQRESVLDVVVQRAEGDAHLTVPVRERTPGPIVEENR